VEFWRVDRDLAQVDIAAIGTYTLTLIIHDGFGIEMENNVTVFVIDKTFMQKTTEFFDLVLKNIVVVLAIGIPVLIAIVVVVYLGIKKHKARTGEKRKNRKKESQSKEKPKGDAK